MKINAQSVNTRSMRQSVRIVIARDSVSGRTLGAKAPGVLCYVLKFTQTPTIYTVAHSLNLN